MIALDVIKELENTFHALSFFSEERRQLTLPGQDLKTMPDRCEQICAADCKLAENMRHLIETSLLISDQDLRASLHKPALELLHKEELALLAEIFSLLGKDRIGDELCTEVAQACKVFLDRALENYTLNPAALKLMKLAAPSYFEGDKFYAKIEDKLKLALDNLKLSDCSFLLNQIFSELNPVQQSNLCGMLEKTLPLVRSRLAEIEGIEDSDLKTKTILGSQFKSYSTSFDPDDLIFFAKKAIENFWGILFSIESLIRSHRTAQSSETSSQQIERLHSLTISGTFC